MDNKDILPIDNIERVFDLNYSKKKLFLCIENRRIVTIITIESYLLVENYVVLDAMMN
jgi:hypothetical protein